MRNRIAIFVMTAAMLAVPALAQQSAQESPLLLPPSVEKQLAARATNVSEVTLGKDMLNFAFNFMNKKDKDEATARNLIKGLTGIYVRNYEFDKPGQYSMEEVEQVRKHFQGGDWQPIVHTHELKSGETTDVMAKMVNGETRGMFILSAEPKELSIVLILGPIHMDQLSQLQGLSGLSSLSEMDKQQKVKVKVKVKDKTKSADGKDGPQ